MKTKKEFEKDLRTSRIRHSLFGFVLGDCLGVPYEFQCPGTFKFKPFAGYGTYNQPPGTWSDDAALTLAMLDAIVDGEYDERTHKDNLKRFMEGEYFPDGRCFDVGNATCRAIISDFTLLMDDSFGNGGLLRIWTLAALSLQKEWTAEKERQVMRQANGLTHSTQELYMTCCELYFGLLKSLYRADCNLERYRLWYGELSLRPDFKQYKTTQGHICNAIENVMDTFFKFPEYDDIMEPMRHIIEKGYDTDSNAALLGALLGAKQEIPENYLKKIRGIERVELFVSLCR
ncbi:MAG: ADP-ribosylglycohydrolase family protein [Bacteroidales bacterium]|nr:ADP-ribosylglycohydrolase family protein [Bacteroidales bacterium]